MNIEDVLKGHGIGGSGSNIKSIQRGSIAFTETQSQKDITISAINIDKSVIIVKPEIGGNARSHMFTGEIINSTTIKLNRSTQVVYGEDATVYWEIIEFNNVKSKQTGSVTSSTSDPNNTIVNIAPINVNKSMLFVSIKASDTENDGSDDEWLAGIRLIVNSTTLKFLFGNLFTTTTHPYIYCWQVIEFN